jgi:hypothetical protein
MSDTKSPIENSLGVDPSDEYDEFADLLMKIEIPDDPQLEDIIKLALEGYKTQMEDIQHIEPKFRARSLEVAKMYLDLAKDAITKNADLRLKFEKLEIERSKKTGGTGTGSDEDEPQMSRDEALGFSRIK